MRPSHPGMNWVRAASRGYSEVGVRAWHRAPVRAIPVLDSGLLAGHATTAHGPHITRGDCRDRHRPDVVEWARHNAPLFSVPMLDPFDTDGPYIVRGDRRDTGELYAEVVLSHAVRD